MAAFVYLTLFLAFFGPSTAINCKGCTPLDSLSFDKLLSKFKVSLVKFDVAYPYGDKHEEFGKFSQSAAEIEDLFVGKYGYWVKNWVYPNPKLPAQTQLFFNTRQSEPDI